MKYTSIYLIGFRAVGKSTIGKALAAQLKMPFIEMDDEIVETFGKSIADLTKNGTSWEEFRKKEQETFAALIERSGMVVGTGGGTLVNTLYGRQNAMLLEQSKTALPVLLTAADSVIETRIRRQEELKPETKRPVLDEQRAHQLQQQLDHYAGQPEKQKQLMVDAIVADSMAVYQQRKPLYAHITHNSIDTGNLSVMETVEAIVRLWKG